MAKPEAYFDQFVENNTAYTLITKVNLKKDSDLTLAKLLSDGVKKDGLKETITYLKSFTGKYPQQIENCFGKKFNNATKNDLANQILNFVKLTFPNFCLKCESDYLPYKQENSAEGGVTCFICKTPAHEGCYKEDSINLNLGIVFVCQNCIQTEGKDKKEDQGEMQNEAEELAKLTDSDESDDESEKDDSDEGTWTEKKKKKRNKKEKYSKKNEICPLLIEGRCPHGFNGKNCEYMHKKTCHRFTNFGTQDMHRAGCKFGLTCRYLHPTLCQNSVKMRTCLNDNCKLAHLKYTKRSDEMRRQNSSYYQNQGENPRARNGFQSGSRYQESQNYNQGYQESQNYKQRTQSIRASGPTSMQSSFNRGRYSTDAGLGEQANDTQRFLANAMQKMQKQLASQIQFQIRKQFQEYYQPQSQGERYEYREEDYPNLYQQTESHQQQNQNGQW